MKLRDYIGIVLMVVMVGCNTPPPVGHPLSEGGRTSQDSPALTGTPSQRGMASRMLENIDSLMWRQPDSALKVMMEFAASPEADSMDAFEGHYCQVLVGELLFKNDYGQSNREEVLKAVGYFDSIVGMDGADIRGKADTRGVSVQRDAFLAARAHYINGVGYYERDSLIEACREYLNALRMMEGHFAENELVGHKARFIALTYTRLMDMFSQQFIQEQAIYCGKQSLTYNKIAHSSPGNMANILYHLGKQYDKLNEADSAACCYEKALELLTERNALLYRDLISVRALFEYSSHNDTVNSLDSLKRMTAQATNETERLNRYMIIGSIYQDMRQYDSAKAYFEPVLEFEKESGMASVSARALREIAMSEGDTLKANQYSQVLAEEAAAAPENLFRASQLNDLFQNYLQKKQEKAEVERRLAEQEAARQRWRRGVVTAVVVLLVLGLGLWWWMAKRRKEHEAETQTLNEEKQQLQTQVDDALQQLQTVDDALQQLQTQADDALQQARAMLPQRVNEIYSSKVENRLERIMAEFKAAYPKALERLAAAHPELNEVERQMAVLNFLHFRAKEEANLTGYTEGTTLKYRSNLNKKAGSDPISALLAEGKI